MTNQMNVKTAKKFFKSLDATDLRNLDSQGGLLAWCPVGGFALSLGEASDRAQHEWLGGLASTVLRTPAQEFATKPAQMRAELINDAEALLCALEAEILDSPGNGRDE
jgi:hypothetical protein